MQIDGSRGASGATLGAPDVQSTQSDMGPDAFMRLLVTQIRNQDPMEPMDTSQMMQQMTQLTEVERLVAIDGRLQSMQLGLAGIANSGAADMVGRTVSASTGNVVLGEIGSANGAFDLQGRSASTRVEIRDGQGAVVRTLDLGPQGPGVRPFTWDGEDDLGTRAPPGRYSISVTALDSEGASVEARTEIRGVVRAVRYDGGFPILDVNGVDVIMGDVRSIEATAGSAPVGSSGALPTGAGLPASVASSLFGPSAPSAPLAPSVSTPEPGSAGPGEGT